MSMQPGPRHWQVPAQWAASEVVREGRPAAGHRREGKRDITAKCLLALLRWWTWGQVGEHTRGSLIVISGLKVSHH